MKEKGALKRIFSKYEKGAPICPDLSGKALGFESCFTAFLFLLSGKLVSSGTTFYDTKYSNPLKYTSLRAAEKVVHFKFVYIEIAYT